MTDHEALLNNLPVGQQIRLTGGGILECTAEGRLEYHYDDHQRDVSLPAALELLTDYDVVVFRYWRDDILALFPYITVDPIAETSMSYKHIGQHGAANYEGMLKDSRPATAEEYADLQSELESMDYLLAIVEDIDRAQALEARQRQLKKRV